MSAYGFQRPAQSTFAALPGLRMHYLEWPGAAAPVLLLHPNRTERAHIVGAATGGNLALLFATRWPERVHTLTVIDPGLALDPALSARVREQMVREFQFASLAAARAQMPFSARWSEAMKDHFSRYSFEPLADGTVEWRYHRPAVVATERPRRAPS